MMLPLLSCFCSCCQCMVLFIESNVWLISVGGVVCYLNVSWGALGSLGSFFGDPDGVLSRYRGAPGSFLGRVGKPRELLLTAFEGM